MHRGNVSSRRQPVKEDFRATGALGFALERPVLLNESTDVIAEKIPELKSLSPEEKLILVGELWDELASHPDAFPPREDHIKVLKERLEHYRQHPGDVVAWEDVKARILGSR